MRKVLVAMAFAGALTIYATWHSYDVLKSADEIVKLVNPADPRHDPDFAAKFQRVIWTGYIDAVEIVYDGRRFTGLQDPEETAMRNQMAVEVERAMGKGPERRNASLRFDGVAIEEWSYSSDPFRKLDTVITFVGGKVHEINTASWERRKREPDPRQKQ